MSIRHCLSLCSVFQKRPRPVHDAGKGCKWYLDLSQGTGTKRPRKRNSKKKLVQPPPADDAEEANAAEEARQNLSQGGSESGAKSNPSSPVDGGNTPLPSLVPRRPTVVRGPTPQTRADAWVSMTTRKCNRFDSAPYKEPGPPSTYQRRRHDSQPEDAVPYLSPVHEWSISAPYGK